jgi:hypothetical protein
MDIASAKSNNELERLKGISLNMIKNLEFTSDDTIRFSGDFKISISIDGEGAFKSRIIENIRKIAMQIRGTHMPVIPWPDTTPEKYNKYVDNSHKYMDYDNYLNIAPSVLSATYKLPATDNVCITGPIGAPGFIQSSGSITGPASLMLPPKKIDETFKQIEKDLEDKVIKDISNAVDDELRDEFDPPLPKPQKRKIKLD